MNKSSKIFISYSWHDKVIVNKIDNDFESMGISLIRDIKDLENYTSIKKFMKKISGSDFVIIVISEAYMKSKNCMFEILELFKDEKCKKRIIPIILEDAKSKIYSNDATSKYIKYWEKQYKDIFESWKSIPPEENVEISENLRIIKNIKCNIGVFIKTLQDLKTPSLDELQNKKYEAILLKINHIKKKNTQQIKRRNFNPEVFNKSVELLNNVDDKIFATQLSLFSTPSELGDWLLSKLEPESEYSKGWMSRSYRGDRTILLAKIIKEMDGFSENAKRIRDRLIDTIVNRPFIYDWEFNDWECELINTLVEALKIIGDDASLHALYSRSISDSPEAGNRVREECKFALDSIGYKPKKV
jgi:hypothetical protein